MYPSSRMRIWETNSFGAQNLGSDEGEEESSDFNPRLSNHKERKEEEDE